MAATNPLELATSEERCYLIFNCSQDFFEQEILSLEKSQQYIRNAFLGAFNSATHQALQPERSYSTTPLSRFVQAMRAVCRIPNDFRLFGGYWGLEERLLEMLQNSKNEGDTLFLLKLLEYSLTHLPAIEFIRMAHNIYNGKYFADYKELKLEPVRDHLVKTFKNAILNHVEPSMISIEDYGYFKCILGLQRKTLSWLCNTSTAKSLQMWNEKTAFVSTSSQTIASIMDNQKTCFGEKLSFYRFKSITGQTFYQFWLQDFRCTLIERENAAAAFKAVSRIYRMNDLFYVDANSRNLIIRDKDAAENLYKKLCDILTLPIDLTLFVKTDDVCVDYLTASP